MTLSRDAALSALMGTWTFSKEMEASRYYNVKAFLVIHFMPDPLQILGCHKKGCREIDNQICQQDTCIDTESNVVEWSEGEFLKTNYNVNKIVNLCD
jgi:hypothetical protein